MHNISLLPVFLLLLDSFVGDEGWIVHLFPEGIEDLLPVGVEVALDLVDGLFLNDPELAFSVTD